MQNEGDLGRPRKGETKWNRKRKYRSTATIEQEPKNYEKAMNKYDAQDWKDAIESQLQQLNENNTWPIIPHMPEGKEVVSSKWVFKKNSTETGFEQDCDDIYNLYASVAILKTFRVFMLVATKFNLPLQQIDVCNAFLNSTIDGEFYLKLLKG
ncbi:hypothetical protein PR048_002531, partial [Dryococelus australis]